MSASELDASTVQVLGVRPLLHELAAVILIQHMAQLTQRMAQPLQHMAQARASFAHAVIYHTGIVVASDVWMARP